MAKKLRQKNKAELPVPARDDHGDDPPAPEEAADGVPRFSSPGGDPFVDGAARAYGGTMIDPAARPLVLRADDPAALAAIGAYALRASGGCDNARAKAANEAINAFAKYRK